MRLLLLGATCALVLLGVGVLPRLAGADERIVQSEHYELRSSGAQAEAEEWSRVLEAAWPQFAAHFGAAPKLPKGGRLTVRMFESQKDMNAAIVAAGGKQPNAGGYYCPIAQTAYAYRQPSDWYTRTLLLHEAAHQFHQFATTKHKSPASWYGEGIVEHLSHHTWDGKTLRTAVVPMLSLEKRATLALAACKSGNYRLDGLFGAGRDVSRPECMHVVRYLLTGQDGKHAKNFKALAKKLDRGSQTTAKQFRKSFGAPKAFLGDYRTWLASVQEPWESLWIEWDNRAADALRGRATAIGLCRRKADTTKLSATVTVVSEGAWRAGILLHWNGPGDFSIGVVKNGKSVQIHRRLGKAWKTVKEGPPPAAPPADGKWQLEAERGTDGVTLRVGGKDFGTFPLPAGSMGLAVDHATVDFTAIRGDPVR
jgi:hypothetical protein